MDVVVGWSACSPSSLSIRVRIPMLSKLSKVLKYGLPLPASFKTFSNKQFFNKLMLKHLSSNWHKDANIQSEPMYHQVCSISVLSTLNT